MPLNRLTPQICRARAVECRRHANSAADPRMSFKWMRLAKAWELTAAAAVAEDMLAESIVDVEKDSADGNRPQNR